MGKVSILLPTRSRPGRFLRCAASLIRNAAHPEGIELLTYIDDDDPLLARYSRAVESLKRLYGGQTEIQVILGPAMGTNRCVNFLAAISTGDLVFHAADDCVMLTMGWDVLLQERTAVFPDAIFLAWFNDKHLGRLMPTHPIVSRVWMKVTGFFLPCYFLHAHSDRRLLDIAQRLGRTLYLDDVVFEHRHYGHGKARKDATAERILTRNLYSLDNDVYVRTRRYVEADVALLEGYIRQGHGSPGVMPLPGYVES